MRTLCVAVLLAAVPALVSVGDIVFYDDFENEPVVGSGNPDGWSIFGAPLLDRGTMHNSEFHSPTASVWVAVDWTGWGWGALTVSNEATRYNIVDDQAVVSSWFRATNEFGAASIAFSLTDADGTQWRTADADLFQPTTTWSQHTNVVGDMVVEAAGNTAGLDYENIVSVGYLAYTAGQTDGNMLQFDDFGVTAIPEPTTMALIAMGLGAFMWRRRVRK